MLQLKSRPSFQFSHMFRITAPKWAQPWPNKNSSRTYMSTSASLHALLRLVPPRLASERYNIGQPINIAGALHILFKLDDWNRPVIFTASRTLVLNIFGNQVVRN